MPFDIQIHIKILHANFWLIYSMFNGNPSSQLLNYYNLDVTTIKYIYIYIYIFCNLAQKNYLMVSILMPHACWVLCITTNYVCFYELPFNICFLHLVYIWFPYFVIIILSILLSYLFFSFLFFFNLFLSFIWPV